MRFIALGLTLLAVLGTAGRSFAAPPIVVGHGTPASCTEMALKDALIIAETVGGATVRFKCGREPVTIELHEVTPGAAVPVLLIIPDNTTLDGDDLITLDGTFTATVAYVPPGATVALKQITITGGYAVGYPAGGGYGGGILNYGRLTVQQSTLTRNFAGQGGGGAIAGGPVTIDRSTISHNGAFFPGGAIQGGPVTVRQSLFEHNHSAYGGGAIAGSVEIVESLFAHNAAETDGGAIAGSGTIRRSIFLDNTAYHGGAIAGSEFDIRHSTFTGNQAPFGGALFLWGDGAIEQSAIVGNGAIYGGGVFLSLGALELTRSTITDNGATVAGSGIYVCRPDAILTLPCSGEGQLSLARDVILGNQRDDIFPVLQ